MEVKVYRVIIKLPLEDHVGAGSMRSEALEEHRRVGLGLLILGGYSDVRALWGRERERDRNGAK